MIGFSLIGVGREEGRGEEGERDEEGEEGSEFASEGEGEATKGVKVKVNSGGEESLPLPF